MEQIIKVLGKSYLITAARPLTSNRLSQVIKRIEAAGGNLRVLAYTDQCTGTPALTVDNTANLLGTYGEVQKGNVWAQQFHADFRCLDSVQFYVMRDANVSFYIEIRRDDTGKPKGTPLVNDAGLVMRTPPISYTELPTSWAWTVFTVGAILDGTAANYWICFVPVDFYDSPVYRDVAYYRFRIQDGTNLLTNPSSLYINGSWGNSSTFAFAVYKKPTFIPACTPSWACEQPLNGYEADGCGNRRLNTICNPTGGCIPNWQCEQPLNGYEKDGCGNRRINTICNPTGGCIPNWQCERPLNGYESDGCGNRRTNSSCNPLPSGPGTGTIIGIGLVGAGLLGAVAYALRKRR